ncbi:MAG: hypothetical protein RR824_06220 [Clostridia bacterium]
MSAFEHWEQQKEPLRLALKEQSDMAGVVYALRHALLQVEQNTLAELSDDVLRQQIGVLFGNLKTSVGLLQANVITKAWVPQVQKKERVGKAKRTLWLVAALVQGALGLLCALKGFALGWIAALAVLVMGGLAMAQGHTQKPSSAFHEDELRITLRPNVDNLLSVLDAQLRAVDRCTNDFSYLNEQLRGGAECADMPTLARFADLLEALYECDEEARAPAEEAAKQMLANMGLRALDYNEESRRLFTALPSKSETRTLSPAIVSAQDEKLLYRGTAAVKMDVA